MSKSTSKITGRFRKWVRKKMTWKFFLLILGVIFLLSIGGCSTLYYVGGKLIDEEKLNDVQASEVIAIDEKTTVEKLGGMRLEKVTINQIPQVVQDAFVSTEDKRFYSHNGIDPIGIARAVFKDIISLSKDEGASTITQQLARNIFLPDEAQTKSFMRKTKEIMIALNLERNYSKKQILEMYLNRGFYAGHGVFGVKTAADYYFGKKDLGKLTLAEVASLAAIPKAPTYYAPTYYEDENEFAEKNKKPLERRNLVLSLMYENGKISKEQMEAAQKEPLVVQKPAKSERATYQAYIDYVVEEAEEKLGIPEDQLYSGGYKIYTYLDQQAQVAAFEKFKDDANFPKNPKGYNDVPVNGAMIILEAKTGGITAMVGRRDYQAKGFNFATRGYRQPGSSIKPLVDYAPALEKGWTPNTLVQDIEKDYAGYKPHNHNNAAFRGPVTMSEALRDSLNAAAVWTLNEIGLNYGISYLEKFGIEVKDENRSLPLALGAQESNPLQMAQAYSAFANNGVMNEAHAIKKITTHDGRLLVPEQKKETQVITPQTAYYMTEMLKGVVRGGTGTAAALASHPVAGKTGTSEEPNINGGNRDAWFVGYTPEYVAAIWMGYVKPDSNHYIQDTGGGKPAKMFNLVMTEAMKGKPVKQFVKPDGVAVVEPPMTMPTITDLSAKIVKVNNQLKVKITWTKSENEAISYKLYRFKITTYNKELIAEGKGNVYFDDYEQGSFYSYVVVPYNTETNQEGNMSNIATTPIPIGIDNPDDGEEPGGILPGIGNNNGNNNGDGNDNGNNQGGNNNNNGNNNDGTRNGQPNKKED